MKKPTYIAGIVALAAITGIGGPAQAQPDTGAQAAPTTASKPAVFRDGGNRWFLRNTPTTGVADTTFTYGLATDWQLMGDWDGDGVKTPGIYRDGIVFLRNSNTSGFADIQFFYGLPTDRDFPIVGDWDGNGTDTIGVYRVSEGNWYLRNSNDNGVADVKFTYGTPFEFPEVGDWDGNGTDTPAVVRAPSQGDFGTPASPDITVLERNSNTAGIADTTVGLTSTPSDVPVVSDFDGNGADQVTLYDVATSRWTSPTGNFLYGTREDFPLVWR
jgi:hypothetical protein